MTSPRDQEFKSARLLAAPVKRDLMEILCCPVCKGDLQLRIEVEEDEILEGQLICAECEETYKITEGIPNLLPPDLR